MNNEVLVLRLLARAFLDIRIAANDGNSKAAFALADLFHNVPYQLERVRQQEGDFAEVLVSLRTRASQKNLTKWLESALSDQQRERH